MVLPKHINGAPAAPLLAADGSPRLPHVAYDADGYPFSDGEPLAQNTPQADQLFYFFPALETLVRERFPDAFSASDMFIYPRRGSLEHSVAPDIFVAFGAGDHPRNSYKLFEGEPVPAFVMEVLSGTTADKDLGRKRLAYAEMGIDEYWMFDPSPFGDDIPGHVEGLRLDAGVYVPIAPLPGGRVYRSEVLGLEFREEGGNLRVRDPVTGRDLRHYREEKAEREAEARARQAAEARADAAEARARAADAEVARLRRLQNDQR